MHRRIVLTVCFLLTPSWLAAQDRTVTVTASRATTVAPDQAVITMSLFTRTTTSRAEVLAALQGSSITLSNFTSVYTTTTYNPVSPTNDDQLV